MNKSFQSWPSFSNEECEAVLDVLKSGKVNYWTGEECRNFEKDFVEWTGTNYSVAVANGTVALDLALKALNIGFGDEVIVTSRTFLASVSSIVISGAIPIFADVSANSQNITVETIQPLITKRTRAILAVHLAGWPCDMDSIIDLARQNNIAVIEDCAQAHGAKINGRSVGSFGDIGCWSFCQDKIMTTGGEGGMVTTNNKELWSSMWSYKDHGKSWEAVYERDHPPGFRWLHDTFGTNWRMLEMQATIGRIQLKRMAEWSSQRISNAQSIWKACQEFKHFRVPEIPRNVVHAAYKCYVFVKPEELKVGWDRDRVMNEISAQGVPCFSGSCSEVYLEKAFEETNLRPKKRLPVAKELGENSLMFLVHPTLSKEDIEFTCEIIRKVSVKCAK